MNKSLAIVFLGVALIITGMVTADANPNARPKVGFVDLERTLRETSAGKRAVKKLDQSRKSKEAELQKKTERLQQDEAELKRQAQMLKPEVLRQRQAKLQKDFVELQELYMKLQRELAGEEAKLVQEILKQAEPLLKKIAREQGFTMIIDRKAVLWSGDDSLDLTAELNRRIK